MHVVCSVQTHYGRHFFFSSPHHLIIAGKPHPCLLEDSEALCVGKISQWSVTQPAASDKKKTLCLAS